jgi:hypothetical protein
MQSTGFAVTGIPHPQNTDGEILAISFTGLEWPSFILIVKQHLITGLSRTLPPKDFWTAKMNIDRVIGFVGVVGLIIILLEQLIWKS